ncbi:energy-coupling factor transporter transmembrane protein EcfT [Ruminococcus sp. OA3]|uniref:energy-coupling factor transporter transmembrane component T n=1 Tax=Ruminococcus sp. OA3 TaxID=2914164 RepID=UPI001F05AB59|nr:energy-coupling factor transporter transmembrane component T [Ruminococcus sp. OA3]MCH1983135.1 energy-coupling factor transporter transmembrane protein EcfT [Ruminococcus sp. OA3]
MRAVRVKGHSIDPRTGLVLLVLANIIAFSQNCFWVECGWVAVLALLMLTCGRVCSGIKWGAGFVLLMVLQWHVLPAAPKIFATSFSIFINYARRMFPCLMVGSLMLHTMSLRKFVAGLRRMGIPQKLIVPISVTLRYFPAIREEAGYIRDAMRLRNVRGIDKIEALVVPLMISATVTAEELSAAAVTRGIENPAPKTSVICLKMNVLDWISLLTAVLFTAAAFFTG